MTLTVWELFLYACAVGVLFLTPGPVWVAIIARGMSGGFRSAWPLAFGVVIGDAIWPFLAVLGVSWLVQEISGFMLILRWVAVAFFVWMGVMLIRNADREIDQNSRLTAPGVWAGFVAGVIVIMANPKAILFYMGILPGFFDLTQITTPDIVAICLVSMLVPLVGNTFFALFVDRMRRLVTTPGAIRRMNIIAGWLLIGVGLVIPFT
ncbi:LysE family translocator [Halocynthiibacter styelae]|uniref:LysE family translocator n=1 Tax=Halocynthiibacter styelae TaxID=2761955 RepID=A0A8J7IYL0_9RHOB|nr:LysE family translocator [Paenihalocynthiibacter styelae]MBI1495273.1 LysE family translocator [Paenihalocynthiibacter styelae]